MALTPICASRVWLTLWVSITTLCINLRYSTTLFNYSTTLYIKPTTNQPLNSAMSHHTTLDSLAGTTPQHSIKLIYTTLGPTTNYIVTPHQRKFHHLTSPDPTPHQTKPHLHYKGNCKEGSPILTILYQMLYSDAIHWCSIKWCIAEVRTEVWGVLQYSSVGSAAIQ